MPARQINSALQASVDKSGFEKDLMDLVCLRISHRGEDNWHTERCRAALRRDDLQREFLLAHPRPWHLAPQQKARAMSPRSGLDGVADALLFDQHALEILRRSLPERRPQVLGRAAGSSVDAGFSWLRLGITC